MKRFLSYIAVAALVALILFFLLCIVAVVVSGITDGDWVMVVIMSAIFASLIFGCWKLIRLLLRKKPVADDSAAPGAGGSATGFGARLRQLLVRMLGFDRPALNDQEINAFYKVVVKILDDGVVTESEARLLKFFFFINPVARRDSRTAVIGRYVKSALSDGVLDRQEQSALFTLLNEFAYAMDGFVDELEDEEDYEECVTLEPGHRYKIQYEDANGNVTTRPIIFQDSWVENGLDYIGAICLKRQAMRTFRGDRVLSIFSMETGEVLL